MKLPVPSNVFKRFDNEADISFSRTNFNIDNTIFYGTLTKDSYDLPDGYSSAAAPYHVKKVNGVEIFDIALGFRSSSLTKNNPIGFPTSPYAYGFYSTITGSGETNSSPAYPGEYLVTSSRIYDYIASKLNNHKDFVFSNSIVDALVVISFKNSKVKARLYPRSFGLKHYCEANSGMVSSDAQAPLALKNTYVVPQSASSYSQIIQRGKNSVYDSRVLHNKDNIEDRVVGRVYQDEGIVLLDLVKLFLRDSNGDYDTTTKDKWPTWKAPWPISAVVSSSYSHSLDRVKDTLQHMFVRNEDHVVGKAYFCRGNLQQFNLSHNPTFWTGSEDSDTKIMLHDPPFTYITSLGLYNDRNELMAIGKLNKPLKKDAMSQFHFTAKINY